MRPHAVSTLVALALAACSDAGDTYGGGLDCDCDGLDCEPDSDGSTYSAVCGPAASWTAAESTCLAAGYDFRSIESASANALVDGLLGVLSPVGSTRLDAFIGYSDVASEATFVWSNGSSSSYTNWYGINPDNGGGYQDCTQIVNNMSHGGGWDDGNCAQSDYFGLQGRQTDASAPGGEQRRPAHGGLRCPLPSPQGR